jgi:hypothetical protein
MRRAGVGVTAAVLAVALAASAAAQDAGDLRSMPPKTPAWWDGWFKAPAAKPAADKKPDGDRPPAGPTPADAAAATRKRELAAYLRRQAVCDRLLQVAVQNNDDDLYRQAQALDARAWEVYQRRTAGVPGVTDADEADLDARLAAPTARGGRADAGQASLMRGGKP